MSVARGQLSATHFDRTYPFQVAVLMPKDMTRFFFVTDLERLIRFTSCAKIHKGLRRENDEFVAYCFTEEDDARKFAEIIGGERVNPTNSRYRRSAQSAVA